jgi:hypothetical protein
LQPDGESRILVSLSSAFFPGQQRVLQDILDALDGLPVEAVVTVGPAVSTQHLRVPENAELHSHLPHAEVLTTVSLVIDTAAMPLGCGTVFPYLVWMSADLPTAIPLLGPLQVRDRSVLTWAPTRQHPAWSTSGRDKNVRASVSQNIRCQGSVFP